MPSHKTPPAIGFHSFTSIVSGFWSFVVSGGRCGSLECFLHKGPAQDPCSVYPCLRRWVTQFHFNQQGPDPLLTTGKEDMHHRYDRRHISTISKSTLTVRHALVYKPTFFFCFIYLDFIICLKMFPYANR